MEHMEGCLGGLFSRTTVHAIKLLEPMRFRGKFNTEFQWLGLATSTWIAAKHASLLSFLLF
jgi:hypothetical protein